MTYSNPHKFLNPYHLYDQLFYQQIINNEAYQENTISLHASHSSTMPKTITSQPCIELYKWHHKSERITRVFDRNSFIESQASAQAINNSSISTTKMTIFSSSGPYQRHSRKHHQLCLYKLNRWIKSLYWNKTNSKMFHF